MKAALVIMAAGMGSRYGGNKQVDGIGPNGEILMEYSIFDALRAGFTKVVFIIKPDMRDLMENMVGHHLAARKTADGDNVEVCYAYQDFSSVPDFYTVPSDRVKPFGTVHALLCAREFVHEPFVVINADDYYGVDAFKTIYAELSKLAESGEGTMVGYDLCNTVSEHGTVTRGVCATENGLLRKVHETYKIQLCPDGTIRDTSGEGEGVALDPEALVSMNMWGYHPAMLDVMAQYFDAFVRDLAPGDEKRECLLPVMMDALTAQGRVNTRVLQTNERWFGLTYQDDKPGVVAALRALHADGTYPPALWK